MLRRYADPIPWREVFEDHRRSGLTQAEFCRRHRLSLHAFRKQRYARPAPSPAPVAQPTPAAPCPADRLRLVPVTLVTDPVAPESPSVADRLVLVLDGRRRIAIAPGFDADTLRRLIGAIEDRP